MLILALPPLCGVNANCISSDVSDEIGRDSVIDARTVRIVSDQVEKRGS